MARPGVAAAGLGGAVTMRFKLKPLRTAVVLTLIGGAVYSYRTYERPLPEAPDPVITKALAHGFAMASDTRAQCRREMRAKYCPLAPADCAAAVERCGR